MDTRRMPYLFSNRAVRFEADTIEGSVSPLKNKRVVIVEDEELSVLVLQSALTYGGLKVVGSSPTAQGGVDLILKERPDLVLMDIRLRGRMTGFDAAKSVLAQYSVCIVIVTSYRDQACQDQAAALGVCGYIIKPVIGRTVIPEIENAFLRWAQVAS